MHDTRAIKQWENEHSAHTTMNCAKYKIIEKETSKLECTKS